jgi:methylated-DNA-[protein]-cysteine S-methyltransferase
MNSTAYYHCPLGWVEIQASQDALISVRLKKNMTEIPVQPNDVAAILTECIRQLEEYFSGRLTCFDLPVSQPGTAFQKRVWSALQTIPFGETISYANIAQKINMPKSTRAVGAACGKNKVWIIVPCHRVIGANGSLTGYAGGLDCKRWLLDHERKYKEKKQKRFVNIIVKKILYENIHYRFGKYRFGFCFGVVARWLLCRVRHLSVRHIAGSACAICGKRRSHHAKQR